MLRNSTVEWGWVSRTLHWSMAALIFGQIILGKYAHELGRTPEKLNLMMWHKSIGITLLLLVVLRLLWTLLNPSPAPGPGTSRRERIAARLSHASLYALMFAIPLSGWLMNSAKNVPFSLYRVVPWPALIGPDKGLGKDLEDWHEGLVTAMLAVLVIHIGAALWHHFLRRDTILKRMWSGKSS